MRKVIIIFVLMSIYSWAIDDTVFYKPSFSCSKVKNKSIDYKICTNEEIAGLDRKLSNVYRDVRIFDDTIKKVQRQWMKKRNQCKDDDCITKEYSSQINLLENKREFLLQRFKKVYKNTNEIYIEKKDVYKALDIYRKSGIEKIIELKPSILNGIEYSIILTDYARLLINTADDTHRHINQKQAQKVLLRAKIYRPKNIELQLLLARSYLIHFKFSIRTSLGWGVDNYPRDESWEWTFPSVLKASYIEYIKLCTEQDVKPDLNDKEWLIVKRERLFIEYYSTFTGKEPNYGNHVNEKIKYKKGYENICSEYIELLNTLPDDEYLQCSRYTPNKNNYFKIAPPVIEGWQKNIYGYKVYYKSGIFIDNYNTLQLKGLAYGGFPGSEKHMCFYQYIDFTLNRQKRKNDSYGCRNLNKHFIKHEL